MAKGKDKEWTLIGAARRGRDLRADTVRHLRDDLAELAAGGTPSSIDDIFTTLLTRYASLFSQSGHGVNAAMSLLHAAHGYTARHFKRDLTLSGARAEVDSILGDLAKQILANDAARLAEADLYVLSPEMCDVVVAAAASLTDEDCQLMQLEDLPTPSGLVVLPHEIAIETATGEVSKMRALRWEEPRDFPTYDANHRLSYYHGMRMATYSDPSQRGEGKARWVVRMHRVRQWYPSENRHKILFRGPYVKGPEGLPIAPPAPKATVVRR